MINRCLGSKIIGPRCVERHRLLSDGALLEAREKFVICYLSFFICQLKMGVTSVPPLDVV